MEADRWLPQEEHSGRERDEKRLNRLCSNNEYPHHPGRGLRSYCDHIRQRSPGSVFNMHTL